ncbi:MAG: 1-acyl-sn-glycerol-3-phosphate acyltransferase [Alphaproteobacteria bacterium]|nr:1-acyl-sn-glycerol-3-phosphate acyltransferase [Alphaproteobacteria bacterium]
MAGRFSHLRAVYRIFLFAAVTLVLVPLQLAWALPALLRGGNPKHQSPIVRLWYRTMLWILHIDMTIINRRVLDRGQKIFLCNHISYVDILVLGAYFDCFFVAKSDIADWPIFGFLSKVGGTIFISRQRQLVKTHLALLAGHVKSGQSLLIFPEGTTGDGREILPFKSSLLHAAFDAETALVIQPLSLAYIDMNGYSLVTQDKLDQIAWYGEMKLAPHFWNLFRQKHITAKVVIHPAIAVDAAHNSKTLCAAAHEQVKNGFSQISPVHALIKESDKLAQPAGLDLDHLA